MADGNVLNGQQYESDENIVIQFTEQMRDIAGAATHLGDARTEILPNDKFSSKVRIFEAPASLADTYLAFAGVISIQLPDILESITVTYNKTRANGLSVSTGDGFSAGSGPSLSLSLDSRSQSSGSILPDLDIQIRQIWASNVPVTNYVFYASGNVTRAEILARLATITATTVNAWPVFKPVSHTINVKGMSASVSVNAGIQQHVSLGDTTSYTKGNSRGFSYSNDLTNRSIRIPPTIHNDITIINASLTDVATASASSSWPGGTNWPAMSESISAASQNIVGSVSPVVLPSTTPGTIPDSGLYLYDYQVFMWKYSLNRIVATVVDCSYFA